MIAWIGSEYQKREKLLASEAAQARLRVPIQSKGEPRFFELSPLACPIAGALLTHRPAIRSLTGGACFRVTVFMSEPSLAVTFLFLSTNRVADRLDRFYILYA